jgi:hypothetical protein
VEPVIRETLSVMLNTMISVSFSQGSSGGLRQRAYVDLLSKTSPTSRSKRLAS